MSKPARNPNKPEPAPTRTEHTAPICWCGICHDTSQPAPTAGNAPEQIENYREYEPWIKELAEKIFEWADGYYLHNASPSFGGWKLADLIFEHAPKADAGVQSRTAAPQSDWKEIALALTTLLRAKCSDDEWAKLNAMVDIPTLAGAAALPSQLTSRVTKFDVHFANGFVSTCDNDCADIYFRCLMEGYENALRSELSDELPAPPVPSQPKEPQ